MKKLPAEKAEKGMVIGKAVCAGDGSVLLTPGTVINEYHLKQLSSSQIRFVEIIETDSVVVHKLFSAAENEFTRLEITQTIKSIFREITLSSQLNKGTIKRTVDNMLRTVLKDRAVLLHLTEVRELDTYIFGHSLNVCMLSLILGLFLKLKRGQLKNLGTAALLHDVGRARVPKHILYKPSPLTVEEFAEVKKHSAYGFEIIRECDHLPEEVTLAVLQHHERLDGSGYPGGLRGEEIGLFARILAVADVFDALLADRPFRQAFFPHQAVDIIINSTGQFDPEVLRVFIENVAIYPVGSVVSLNTGETGIVVDVNKGQQTRPVIRVMYDSNEIKLQSIKEIDLSKNPEIFIARVLREEQVENIIG
ncbi:HD-GYP domain-containing protein [Phosphitispora fastidiosa]|uniref:HD-GYP domain-containing protein n=1 Tax=Phosphitispora fastidiosa TaxID=2837202 RepID=UPI001E51D195|nr:HD-GYP domain-containing protein [Phosphitispora fastidiosa]MBU7008641.1 HD-GYP domain-containing protein (c-di-GMP phosphodiesterase class II) [Phosphitispora fastidiosa]